MTLPLIIHHSKIKKQVPVSAALQLQCQQRIAQCWHIAKENGVRWPLPTVSFDLRGTTAGRAYLVLNHIQLNPVLLNENSEAFLAGTVGHEAAHLIAHFHFGAKIQGHGSEWESVMQWLGQAARRCHNFDTRNAAVIKKTIEYKCGCFLPHFLTTKKHLRIQAHRHAVICSKCRHPLRWAIGLESSEAAGVVQVAKKPSPAMIKYAQVLAQQKKVTLSLATLDSFVDTYSFIESHKRGTNRLPPPVLPPDAPTEKQLAWANKLAKQKNLPIPPAALSSKHAMSAWLSTLLSPVR
ncbi:MAG: SprT-like domain-containing protein [Agitococcus sp.]|nr:SprT-like domain-containing protein [Agitococcus sp.]